MSAIRSGAIRDLGDLVVTFLSSILEEVSKHRLIRISGPTTTDPKFRANTEGLFSANKAS